MLRPKRHFILILTPKLVFINFSSVSIPPDPGLHVLSESHHLLWYPITQWYAVEGSLRSFEPLYGQAFLWNLHIPGPACHPHIQKHFLNWFNEFWGIGAYRNRATCSTSPRYNQNKYITAQNGFTRPAGSLFTAWFHRSASYHFMFKWPFYAVEVVGQCSVALQWRTGRI